MPTHISCKDEYPFLCQFPCYVIFILWYLRHCNNANNGKDIMYKTWYRRSFQNKECQFDNTPILKLLLTTGERVQTVTSKNLFGLFELNICRLRKRQSPKVQSHSIKPSILSLQGKKVIHFSNSFSRTTCTSTSSGFGSLCWSRDSINHHSHLRHFRHFNWKRPILHSISSSALRYHDISWYSSFQTQPLGLYIWPKCYLSYRLTFLDIERLWDEQK